MFVLFSCIKHEKQIVRNNITNESRLKNFTVKGIDVSHHQGKINWSLVKTDNVKFVFIKATEGSSFKDPMFRYNLNGCKENNILVGSYHYYRIGTNNQRQLKNFTMVVKKKDLNFPPVVDVEYFSNEILHDIKNKKMFVKKIDELSQLIESHYGVKPIIYTDVKFYNNLIKNEFDNILWISDLKTKKLEYLKNSQWLFWQYSFRGKIKGIDKDVDLNVFQGDYKNLKKYQSL